jgi:hypothetical protein
MDTKNRNTQNWPIILCFSLIVLLIGCQPILKAKFEGEWGIVMLKDRYYSRDRHISLNTLSIHYSSTPPKVFGFIPDPIGDLNSSCNLIDVITYTKDGKGYVHFEFTEPQNPLFKDTFEIVYLESDSFFIKSNDIHLKCVKWK